MTERGRVDLEHMQAIYERERAGMARTAAEERIRILRAQVSIDGNCHMVGRVGRFELEPDEPPDAGPGQIQPDAANRALETWVLSARTAPGASRPSTTARKYTA